MSEESHVPCWQSRTKEVTRLPIKGSSVHLNDRIVVLWKPPSEGHIQRTEGRVTFIYPKPPRVELRDWDGALKHVFGESDCLYVEVKRRGSKRYP